MLDPVLGCAVKERHGHTAMYVQCRATRVMKGLEPLCNVEKLRVPGEETVQRAFIHLDRPLMGEVKV